MNYLKKKKISNPTRLSKVKKCYWTAAGAAALCLCCVTPAMAAGGDPLDIVNNLSDFIFSIIKALGVIILGWGIDEMCRALSIGKKTGYKLLQTGQIRFLKIGRAYRIPKINLLEYLQVIRPE